MLLFQESLDEEVKLSRQEIATDGYEMSIGELMSLYNSQELIINPQYQRYFRWDISQKTKFIESILLGIPLPAIFVFQTDDGRWELVDGLQRLSTIFEFVGILRDPDTKQIKKSSVLEGTKLLPSLVGKKWEASSNGLDNGISRALQLDIKRARMRVEILKRESDPQSKYQLFQRLNAGGSALTEQEIRNCVMVMIDPPFSDWINTLSEYSNFKNTIGITDKAEKRQKAAELVLRFIIYRNKPYQGGLDVHEYLDDGVLSLVNPRANFDRNKEETVFKNTFDIIHHTLNNDAFHRYDGGKFVGSFSISAFEVIAIGISKNLQKISQLSEKERDLFIKEKVRNLWSEPAFKKNSGAGVRGTTRLYNLIPLSESFFNV